MNGKGKTSERERRDWIIILIILLFGFLCVIMAGEQAVRFSPNWKLDTNMRSNLDPDSDFLTNKPVSFYEPLDPSILTQPAWINVFLTPGALFETRMPAPPTNTPIGTNTLVPTLFFSPTAKLSTSTPSVILPTNTPIYFPPSPTNTPKPPPTNTPLPSTVPVDLQITKTDSTTTYVAGTSITYTIVVTNNGLNNVTGATISDPKPTQVTTWGWCVAPCTPVANSSANLNDTINLASGASITYTVSANINPGATGNLVNTASVSVPAGYTDTVPGNNSATDTDTLVLNADLQITKTDGTTTYTPGTSVTYTIVVTNGGPDNVTGAIVTDNKPTQITTWSWVCTSQTGGANGCNAVTNSNANFSDTVNLPNGASIIYTVTANISGGATGNLVNTATINVPAGYTDPTSGNNSATDTDTLTTLSADLSITKDDGVTTYVPGNAVTYTITVINNGPNNVTGAIVTDNKPTNITTWSWVCTSQTGGATGCDGVAINGTDFNDIVDLPNGASIVYTVTANVSGGATGNITNIATIDVPAGYSDPTPANNSASDIDSPNLVSDLAITTNTDNSTDYAPSTTKTYTVVVSNAGPSNVTGATVTDNILTNANIASWTCSASGSATCTASGSGNINDTVNIPVGSTLTYTVMANVVASPSGTLDNTATVSVPVGVNDPNLLNNSATDTDQLVIVDPSGNIGTVPDGSSTTIPAGTYITLQFGAPLVVGSPDGYDLVYYPDPTVPTLQMDVVILQVSNGSNWYTILNWGNGSPDANTDIPAFPPNPTNCTSEPDNCLIEPTLLTNSPGISIQLDGVVPSGTYPYIRIFSPSAPLDSGDGVEADAIEVLP